MSLKLLVLILFFSLSVFCKSELRCGSLNAPLHLQGTRVRRQLPGVVFTLLCADLVCLAARAAGTAALGAAGGLAKARIFRGKRQIKSEERCAFILLEERKIFTSLSCIEWDRTDSDTTNGRIFVNSLSESTAILDIDAMEDNETAVLHLDRDLTAYTEECMVDEQ